MPIDLKKYQQLKDKVDQAQRQADKAAGALDQLMQQLKKEFDCDSLEEAEKLKTKLQKEEVKKEKEFTDALEEFERQWGDKLKG